MSSTGVFRGMRFDSHQFGRLAIVMLESFAPPSIHAKLWTQLPNLVTIHDQSQVPRLGVTGSYEWWLGVWSRSEFVISMVAERTDRRAISVAEGLAIEREALGRAEPTAKRLIKISPYGYHGTPRDVLDKVSKNLEKDRHWARGLS